MEKAYNNGLVLGKFYPFHNGHKFLIDTAVEYCETVYVLVCSLERETIPGYERYKIIRNTYAHNSNVNVIHITDENPQYPSDMNNDLDAFYDIWVNTVYKNVPELDVVFTSEEYGDEFASYLKVKHHLVDLERKTYPISGTQVRNDMKTVWDMLPIETKRLFTKKVLFLGPESSGKSTLSKKLAEHYNMPLVGEYGREYTDKFIIEEGNREYNEVDLLNIATGQISFEEKAILEGKPIIFCDTDLMTTQLWSEILIGYSPGWIIDQSYKIKYDLYLLMDIDFEWVNDGTRGFKHLRQWYFNRIKEELEKRNLPYHVISGTIEERFEKVKNILSELSFPV